MRSNNAFYKLVLENYSQFGVLTLSDTVARIEAGIKRPEMGLQRVSESVSAPNGAITYAPIKTE